MVFSGYSDFPVKMYQKPFVGWGWGSSQRSHKLEWGGPLERCAGGGESKRGWRQIRGDIWERR